MKIAIASDHAGFLIKKHLLGNLENYEVEDFGPDSEETVDYPVYAKKVAKAVVSGYDKGILICGTGIGMSITANKIKGVYAARCSSEEDAELAAKHNDANIICLGGRQINEEMALRIVEKWMSTEFEGGRHKDRVDQIEVK
jgi:ribose 5-phosphate isomerase B